MQFLYYVLHNQDTLYGIPHFLVEEAVSVQLFYNNILESTLTVQHSLPVDCCYSLLGSWERLVGLMRAGYCVCPS